MADLIKINFLKLNDPLCKNTWQSLWVIPTSIAPNLIVYLLNANLSGCSALLSIILIVWLLISGILLHNFSLKLARIDSDPTKWIEGAKQFSKEAYLQFFILIVLPLCVLLLMIIDNIFFKFLLEIDLPKIEITLRILKGE